MMACQAQNVATVSLLLLEGIDPKCSTTTQGITALHIACKVDDLASACLLLQFGADTGAKLKNKHKDTPQGWAYRKNPTNSQTTAKYTTQCRMKLLTKGSRTASSSLSSSVSMLSPFPGSGVQVLHIKLTILTSRTNNHGHLHINIVRLFLRVSQGI